MMNAHRPSMIRRATLRSLAYAALPATVLFLGGCFATQADIQVLQGDLVLMRNEQVAADSAHRVQLDRVLQSLHLVTDSLAVLNSRFVTFRGDATGNMTAMQQQLIQIQELTGQSQRKLQELRESFDERQQQQVQSIKQEVPAKGKGQSKAPNPDQNTDQGTDTTASTPDVTPSATELFHVANQQLAQGSNDAARSAFQDLLDKYPKSDLVPDAQYGIAQSYAADGNKNAADSVYTLVAKKYPKASVAATAIYKRAVAATTAGDTDTARALFQQVIKKYPHSDEASLAHDRIKELDEQ